MEVLPELRGVTKRFGGLPAVDAVDFTVRAEGLTLLLIEHDMRLVMRVSDRIVVVDDGRRIAEGMPEELRGLPAHRIVAALRLARRAYVLETGRIAFSGPAAELLADERVRRAYLGAG